MISAHKLLFTNIRTRDAEFERAELERRDIALPSTAAATADAVTTSNVSPFVENDLRIDNAALSVIMAKELAFLNRTFRQLWENGKRAKAY